jgi:hypothetical protein
LGEKREKNGRRRGGEGRFEEHEKKWIERKNARKNEEGGLRR